MSGIAPTARTVRDIIEANRYLVLATADATGRPWSSPVYFAHIDFSEFFWLSLPDVTHSRNIAARPEVGIVVFDSQVAIGTGQGEPGPPAAQPVRPCLLPHRPVPAIPSQVVGHRARRQSAC